MRNRRLPGADDQRVRQQPESAPAQLGADGQGTAGPDRRRFLGWLTVALGGLAASIAAVPFLGALFWPLRREEQVWRAAARVDEVPVGSTVRVAFTDADPEPWAGSAALSAAWLRHESEGEFIAFSMYCTHTGCPVRWDDGSELFFCPCHGGVFARDGEVEAGPPPAPLARHPVRVRGGVVEVRTIGVPTPGA